MKRFKRIGIMSALIMILISMSITVVASAASVPKDLKELESDVTYQTVTESGNKVGFSIPVQGYIVNDAGKPIPPTIDPKPKPSKPVEQPRTGDNPNEEIYLILLLSSLLMLLISITRKNWKESHKSLENAR